MDSDKQTSLFGLMFVRSTLLALMFASLACPVAKADQGVPPLPAPGEWGSHKAYSKALQHLQEQAREELTGRYDIHLTEHPDDVVAAVERCAFELSQPTGEFGIGSAPCVQELGDRFPHEVKSVVFRLEHTWGPERTALATEALASSDVRWSPRTRAKARLLHAEVLQTTGETAEAARQAYLAMQEWPRADGALIYAGHLISVGKKDEAREALVRNLEATESPVEFIAKARLLADLEAYAPALRALQAAGADVDHQLYAKILAGLGRTAEARERYAKVQGEWNRGATLLGLFELDLARGTGQQALESYDALRDHDFWNDPLLRHRLRLFWSHPTLPWKIRDVLGALLFVALLVGFALMPVFLFAPVHYVGLWRASRGMSMDEGAGRRLAAAWALCACLIVIELVVTYFFCYGDLAIDVFETLGEASSDRAIAQCALLGSAASGLFIVGWAYPSLRVSGRVLREARVGRRIALSLVWMLPVAVVYGVFVRAVGATPDLAAAAAAPEMGTLRMLRAVTSSYGFWGLASLTLVLAPLVEELLFRVTLLDAFSHFLPGRVALGLQAVLFALMHDAWLMWPVLALVGVQAARLRVQTGTVWSGILFHACWNILPTLGIYATTM